MKHAGWTYVFAVGAYLLTGGVLAQPAGCGASNQFACIKSPDVGGSYCLRGPKRDPQFVRAVHNPDSWLVRTDHHVNMGPDYVQPGSPCAVAIPDWKSMALQQGDDVRITKVNADYYFDVISKQTGNSYFNAPLHLSAPTADALWLVASTADVDPNKRFDYFVMLSDDGEGNPNAPDAAKIEKYYRVELFPSYDNPGNTLACSAERPDFFSIGIPSMHIPTLTNYNRWTDVSAKEKCVGKGTIHPDEVVSSGGGEHPPG
jgi:hypothetical protein